MWYKPAANEKDGAITPTAGNVMPPGMPQPGVTQGQSTPNISLIGSGPGQQPPAGDSRRAPPQNTDSSQGPLYRTGSRSGTPHAPLQRQPSRSEEDPKIPLRPRSREGGRPGHENRGQRARGEYELAGNVHYHDPERRRERDPRSTSSERRVREPRYRDGKQYAPERGGDQDPRRPDPKRYHERTDGRRYSDESIRSNSTDKGERRYPQDQERYANDNRHGYPNEQYPRNKHTRGSRRERYPPTREYDDTKPYPPERGYSQEDLESLESFPGSKEPLSRTSSGQSLSRQSRILRYPESPYDNYPGGLEDQRDVSTPVGEERGRRPRNKRERSSPGNNMSRSPPRGPQYDNSSVKRTSGASPRHSITVEDVDAQGSLVTDAFGAHDPNRIEGVPKHHLDPNSAASYKVNKQESQSRKVESMIRNDSLSSDQSECVRPPPPKPHKAKTSRAKRRQFSLSSSEEEIRSTPDYTSPDEGELESESVSERGK